MNILKWFVAIAACFFICLVVLFFSKPRSILAQRSGAADSFYNREFAAQYILFETRDGEKISGWLFNRGKGSDLVVCFAGNSCNAGMYTEYACRDIGRSYLMLNYRGYGASTGNLTEKNMVQDACDAIAFYAPKLAPSKITLLGFSLGTGVAIQVADKCRQVSRLILVCPFDSMANTCLGSGFNIKKYLYDGNFDSIRFAPRLQQEVFVIYSKDDTTVRPEQTERLLSCFTCKPQVFVVNGGHSDVITQADTFKLINNIISGK